MRRSPSCRQRSATSGRTQVARRLHAHGQAAASRRNVSSAMAPLAARVDASKATRSPPSPWRVVGRARHRVTNALRPRPCVCSSRSRAAPGAPSARPRLRTSMRLLQKETKPRLLWSSSPSRRASPGQWRSAASNNVTSCSPNLVPKARNRQAFPSWSPASLVRPTSTWNAPFKR
jgi:hypothetical protein